MPNDTVGLEYQFDTGKAVKNQIELIKNFVKIEKVSEMVKNSAKKVSEVLNKTPSKPKEQKADKPVGGMSAMAVAGGMAIYNTALGAMSGAMSAMNKNFPAIGQAIENIGDMVSTNFFRPLAKEVLPVIMSIHNWVAKNRIVFVQLGEILAGVFRSAMAIGKTVFNALKGAFNGFMSAFGSGKVTIDKFVNFLTMTGFKIYFVFDELAKMLTPLIESIGIVFGLVWKNSVSPFIDGMTESFINDLVPAISSMSGSLNNINKNLKNTGKESKATQSVFMEMGKSILSFPLKFLIGIGDTLDAISNWADDADDSLRKMFSKGISYLVKFGKFLWSEIKEKFGVIKVGFDNFTNSLSRIPAKVDELKKSFFDLFSGSGISGMKEKLMLFFNSIGEMWNSVKKSLLSSPMDLLDKVFSFGSGIYDKVADVLKGAWASSLNWLIDKMPKISSAFGLEKIEMRAAGGAVTANNPYIVGEKGAELFMPEKSGSIMNNNDLKNLNKPVANNANAMSANSSYIDNRVFNFNIQASSPMEVAKEVQSKVDFGSEMKRWKAKAM